MYKVYLHICIYTHLVDIYRCVRCFLSWYATRGERRDESCTYIYVCVYEVYIDRDYDITLDIYENVCNLNTALKMCMCLNSPGAVWIVRAPVSTRSLPGRTVASIRRWMSSSPAAASLWMYVVFVQAHEYMYIYENIYIHKINCVAY
jgi:hypothetical protein